MHIRLKSTGNISLQFSQNSEIFYFRYYFFYKKKRCFHDVCKHGIFLLYSGEGWESCSDEDDSDGEWIDVHHTDDEEDEVLKNSYIVMLGEIICIDSWIENFTLSLLFNVGSCS